MIVVLSTVHSIIGLLAAFFDAASECLSLFRSEKLFCPIEEILQRDRFARNKLI